MDLGLGLGLGLDLGLGLVGLGLALLKVRIGQSGFIYAYIPSYTATYIKILNIGKMTVNIRHKNDRKCGPWGSPMARIWHVPYYHIVKGFFKLKGPQF